MNNDFLQSNLDSHKTNFRLAFESALLASTERNKVTGKVYRALHTRVGTHRNTPFPREWQARIDQDMAVHKFAMNNRIRLEPMPFRGDDERKAARLSK